MQCEVRAMSEARARSRNARTSDTLPKPGRVTEVCKEWVVHEDGALAYRLQKEEVEQHLTGNKSRNAIVREDFPRARQEQQKEEEEAIANYHRMVMQQEEKDAAVARQLAHRIHREEEEKRRQLELHDKHIARQIQERELKRHSPVLPPPIARSSPVSNSPSPPPPIVGDVNRVGLPDVSDVAASQFRNLSVKEDWPPPPSPPPLELLDDEDDEHQRRLQEQRDEELARLLQQQEGGEPMSQIDRDRLVAIEAQDKELARLLQEKERARARRARERAKQKALLKKQQEAATSLEVEGGEEHFPSTQETSSQYHQQRHRYSDPEAIEVLSSGNSHLPNIAMAIDPTYSPHSTTKSSHISSPIEMEEYDEEGPAPPYMPIQGQRRTSSLEKKKKKQPKDGCKQQ